MAEQRGKPTKITTMRDSAAGEVVHEGGRNVWRWKKSSPNDSTSVLLKRLDNDELQLEPTARVARPSAPDRSAPGHRSHDLPSNARAPQDRGHPDKALPGAGGGFDPYNSTR